MGSLQPPPQLLGYSNHPYRAPAFFFFFFILVGKTLKTLINFFITGCCFGCRRYHSTILLFQEKFELILIITRRTLFSLMNIPARLHLLPRKRRRTHLC